MADEVFTNYSTIAPLFAGTPSWVPTFERERVQSYDAYDMLYWNHNTNIKVLMRGTDDISPIYVPEAKVLVNTTDRYVAPGLTFVPTADVGSPASRQAAVNAFNALMRRERFKTRYNANKLFGLVRGDWCWHVTADTTKPAGSRLRILPIHPGNYFPVTDENDPDRIEKVYLAERLLDDAGKAFVKRHTYERLPSGQIISTIEIFDEDKWFIDGQAGKETLQPPTPLDPRITAFPVYHIATADAEPGQFWGSSVLRGTERIIAGLTQALSDEDYALALEGLGVYYTENAAQPKAIDGTPVEWSLYPGRVVSGAKLERVQGIGSLSPYGEHIERMIRWCREANAVVDVAVGKVDAATAESGISLALQLGPMLASAAKKDDSVLDAHTQMAFDLVQGWFPAYEGLNFTDVEMLPVLSPKIPLNVEAEVNRILALVTAKIMSKATARTRLVVYGYTFAENEEELVNVESAAEATAAAPMDQFAQTGADTGAAVDNAQDTGAEGE